MDNPVYLFLAIAVIVGAVSLKLAKVTWWAVALFALVGSGLGYWGVAATPGAALIGGAAGSASPYLINVIFDLVKSKLGSIFEVKVKSEDEAANDKAEKDKKSALPEVS